MMFFRLTDISKAKYKSEAEIEEAKKKAGITYGKWYNNKIVYIHNYSDMDDNVKEDDPISHGAHVAGTAVGNASQPSPNGELSVVLLQKPTDVSTCFLRYQGRSSSKFHLH